MHLSLAGTDSSAVVLGSGGGSGTIAVADSLNGLVVELGVDGNGAVGDGLASSALALLLVGGNVEGDEEEEVAGKDTAAGECSKLLTGAAAKVGNPGPVGGGEVGVGCKVNGNYLHVSNALGNHSKAVHIQRSMTN